MQFINTTPASALCHVANPDDTDRVMTVTAKVTFIVDESGDVRIDTDNPYPVQMFDKETELGVLPQDIMPRSDEVFEVCCLGKAHAPYGRPVSSMQVRLAVGDVERTLNIFGDRHWIGEGDRSSISDPEPFMEMPLTWGRTFGGKAEVLIDKDTPVDLQHGLNPLGKGYNPIPEAELLCRSLKAPEGYPVCPEARPLPNIESPDEPIRNWDDMTSPLCWAPLPTTSPMYMKRLANIPNRLGREDIGAVVVDNSPIKWSDRAAYRAPDDLLIEIPGRNTEVKIVGMTPTGEFRFRLPALRFFIDYLFGTKEGTCELHPKMLILLPEEQRFYLVFKDFYSFGFVKGMERCLRVRAEHGWTPLAKGEAR